jgi:hypothetical protein
MRRFEGGMLSGKSFFPETDSKHVDEEWRHFVKHNKTFVDAPGVYRIVSQSARHYGYESRNPVHVWMPKADAIPQLQWPAGTYRLSRLVVARDAAAPEATLPDDLLHPQFLCAVEFAESPEASDKLIFPDEDRARNSTRKRRETRASVSPFTATAGQHNEWRLPIPPRLADILTEPEPAETTAAKDPDEWPAVSPAPTRAAAAPAVAAPSVAPAAAPAAPRASHTR